MKIPLNREQYFYFFHDDDDDDVAKLFVFAISDVTERVKIAIYRNGGVLVSSDWAHFKQ